MMMFPKIKGICQTVKKPSVLWDKLLGVLGGLGCLTLGLERGWKGGAETGKGLRI